MRWRAVEVEVVFLHILAVIPFTVGQTKKTLFENRIASVPESNGKAQLLLIVGDAGQTIFSPSISARAGLIVAEVIPRVSVTTVVLTHRAPLPFAQIWSPFLPGNPGLAGLVQALLFGCFGVVKRNFLYGIYDEVLYEAR